MSLLMDALKQAENAKHSAQTETPLPTAAAPMLAEDISASLAEFSLTPVIPDVVAEVSAPASSIESDITPTIELTLSPAVETSVETATTAHVPEPAITPEISRTVETSTQDEASENGHSHNGPAAAARILAVSATQHAALRRRNLVGVISLGAVLVIAVGSYYYYATLAQQSPFLGLPQPPSLAAAATDTNLLDTATDDTSTPAAGLVTAADSTQATLPDAADDTALSTALPLSATGTQTPWQEGLPPAAPAQAQDWEPAPVDPRVIRGEQPLPYAAQIEPATPPKASIKITRSTQPNQVSVDLQTAYHDFQTGRLTQAEDGYQQVLDRDADNRDAHMGLAAIAVRNNQLDTARQHYAAILKRNSKDLNAQAAMSDLGQDRPADSESQLKLMLTEQPQSAQLNFALANLYAQQQRWPYAQQAYFDAQRLAPEHPDYAFNLAVSLEHLAQTKLALEYYRRAVMLAGQHNAQFDLSIAQQRINALSTLDQP